MTKLEVLAQQAFSNYSMKYTGKVASWQHLSNERKVEWMRDVLDILCTFTTELKKEIRPVKPDSPLDPIFTKGMNKGIREERFSFLKKIEALEESFLQQLEQVRNRK